MMKSMIESLNTDPLRHIYHRVIGDWILGRLREGSFFSVLDVGTSDHRWPSWLVRQGLGVTVSDRTEKSASRLRDQGFSALALDIEGVGDGSHANFFSAVTAVEILEHLVDPVKALCRINELLAPSGWLYLSTPNFNYYRDILMYAWGKDATIHHNPHHVRFFNSRTIHWLLKAQGFEIVRWHADLPGEGRKARLARPLLPQELWRRLSWRYGAHVIVEARKKGPCSFNEWIAARMGFYQELGL
ncbi:MAG: class I SAM-dependent methyltransferase [Elusimicrobia bacterium]|nr:class I SAM-dependent methyltransferase [Elusimicrobiota bacterium]